MAMDVVIPPFGLNPRGTFCYFFFFFQAEDGIRDRNVTGVQTCALPIFVFDFDETLLPDSTSKLLQSRGLDPHEFWTNDVRRRLEQGFDPTLAYLGLILNYVGADRPLGRLSNRDLREFGATLDADYFPGLPELFDDLRRVAAE